MSSIPWTGAIRARSCRINAAALNLVTHASNYDKTPAVAVDGAEGACVQGWDAVAERLRRAIAERNRKKVAVVVECYPGVEQSEVLGELEARLSPGLALDAREAMLCPERIDALVEPFLGGDDPVFGFLCGLGLPRGTTIP